MDEQRISKNGNCYQCGKTFGMAAMKNHVLKEHNIGEEASYLLKIESAQYKDYWLYIDIPKSKKIGDIDKFLRDIWLECCGHMSRFANSRNSRGDIGKTRTVGSFNAGDELYYEYDMGTTTDLYIKFIGEIMRPKQTSSVRLLARNIAPALACFVCGIPAKFICTECMYDPSESVGSVFCEKHSKKHEHDDMMLPLANSPRNGECGYTGEQDLYGFTGNLKRDQETSIGKLRRYQYVFAGDGDKEETKNIKAKKSADLVASEIAKSLAGPKSGLGTKTETLLDQLLSGDLDESDLTDDNLLEMFGEFKNNLAIQGKPFFTLAELFDRHNIAELRELAKMAEMKNFSKQKKDELIFAITDKLTEPEKLKNIFSVLADGDFNLFSEMMEKDYFVVDDSIFQNIFVLSAHIFMVFHFEGEYRCVIPREIKEAYKAFADESFFENRKKVQNFNKYAQAAANLYGIIKTGDFIDIFNHYDNSLEKDIENTEKILGALSISGEQYGILDGYLIHGSLYYSAEVKNIIKHLAKLKENKSHYIPPSEEFLKYENPDYHEETAETLSFKEYLKKNGFKNTEKLEKAFLDIMWSIKNGLDDPFDFIKILEEQGFKLKSQDALAKCVEIAAKMRNASRMWINNGHTPKEI